MFYCCVCLCFLLLILTIWLMFKQNEPFSKIKVEFGLVCVVCITQSCKIMQKILLETWFGLLLSAVQRVSEDSNYLQAFLSAWKSKPFLVITRVLSSLSLSVSYPSSFFLSFFIFSFPPPLLNISCWFPIRHFDLRSCCLKCRHYFRSVDQSPASQWRTELERFHTGPSVSKQRDEVMKCHDRVIVLGLYFPAELPSQKCRSLEIQWSHMVGSNFHPRSWFDITKSPIMMRWYTDSDTCLADFLSVQVFMWLNVCVRIVQRRLNHKITVGYLFHFLYHLFLWRMYWSATSSFKCHMRPDDPLMSPLVSPNLQFTLWGEVEGEEMKIGAEGVKGQK